MPSKDSLPKKRPIYEDKKRKKIPQQLESKEVSESMELCATVEVMEQGVPEKEETPPPVEPEEEEDTEDAGLDDWEAMASDEETEKVEGNTVHIEVKETLKRKKRRKKKRKRKMKKVKKRRRKRREKVKAVKVMRKMKRCQMRRIQGRH